MVTVASVKEVLSADVYEVDDYQIKAGILGEQYRLTVRSGTRPFIDQARRVPFAIQAEVERQTETSNPKG